ncbi:MAG TPA: serine hydrolase domain-containing protein [Acidimicrobiia bacterium]|nr:serine hydrolase domain-containing protein [Acidimicrobiia bacterium]
MAWRPRGSDRRARPVIVGAWVAVGLLGLGLSGNLADAASTGAGRFGRVDAAMRRRVRGSGGGATVVVHDRTTLFRRTYGGLRTTTPIPIASASKWLTSATLMTLVDQGRLALDDPVAKYLPSFGVDKGTVTIRSLLSHTSGLPDSDCVGDPTITLRACVDQTAAADTAPGVVRAFHYSSVGYEVAGRVIEVLTGEPFERAFEDRIANPIGMRRTRFDGTKRPRSPNPDPSASAISTVDDYTRFLDMVEHLGTSGTHPILSPTSVLEIERDQVQPFDTSRDPAVAITRIHTYGLGVWRDTTDPADGTVVASGNGALGFYPWIDRAHADYGIVGVVDDRGPDHAVPASQRVARLEWTAAATGT